VPGVCTSICAVKVIEPLRGTSKLRVLAAKYLMWSNTLKSAEVRNGTALTENLPSAKRRVSSAAISPGPKVVVHFWA